MKQKFTLLFLACCCAATFSFAQINKGSIYAGGSFSLTAQTEKSGDYKSTSTYYSIAPSFGYAYNTNRIIGGSLFYGHAPRNDSSGRPYNLYGAGIFLRQYKEFTKSFYIFADEGLNYIYYKYGTSGNTSKNSSIALSLNPGLAYDVTRKMQLELVFPGLVSLSYNTAKYSYGNADATRNSSFNISSVLNGNSLNSVSVGFRFYLTRK